MIPVSISSKKSDDFHTPSNIIFPQISKWFSASKLALKIDETNIINFITKDLPQHASSNGCKNNMQKNQ
jgi:hypothetical protein